MCCAPLSHDACISRCVPEVRIRLLELFAVRRRHAPAAFTQPFSMSLHRLQTAKWINFPWRANDDDGREEMERGGFFSPLPQAAVQNCGVEEDAGLLPSERARRRARLRVMHVRRWPFTTSPVQSFGGRKLGWGSVGGRERGKITPAPPENAPVVFHTSNQVNWRLTAAQSILFSTRASCDQYLEETRRRGG